MNSYIYALGFFDGVHLGHQALLDAVKSLGYEQVLLVGHIGKLVKVAGGIMNTHSKMADCRRELMAVHCALVGGSSELCRGLMEGATTDACIALLAPERLVEPVMQSLMNAMERQLIRRVGETCQIGAVMFSKEYGLLGRTSQGKAIQAQWENEREAQP